MLIYNHEKDADGFCLSDKEKAYSNLTQTDLRLAKPIYGMDRKITADSWYSSKELEILLAQADLRLAKTIYGMKRNITADNWYSAIELVNLIITPKLYM